MIKLSGISKTYSLSDSALTVLHDIDFEVADGEMVAIMGPSGSGKTTLLNIIGCLDRPSTGTYVLNGREVSKLSRNELAAVRGRDIGFIFQSFNLLPYLTALGNVRLGIKYAGQSDDHRAQQALESVNLNHRMKHRPEELSGGERQRVAIARAIVKRPPLVLADEPTGNLDSHTGEEILGLLTELNSKQGVTMVVVTHNEDIARLCHRVVRLRDGQIVEDKAVSA
jgi:putative ABC transport system ATP-binding protein